jgi:hypothetical protein
VASDLLAAAERVREAVRAAEDAKYVRLTQAELDALPTYQFTMPTSPSPGFRYKRERWRTPDGRWWHGPHESAVRWAIGEYQQGSRVPPNFYKGPLESYWLVYDCVLADEPGYVDHVPREAKIVDEHSR